MASDFTVIRVFGIVQGVGFRPFVARLATRFSIVGTVANRGSYVEIVAHAPRGVIEKFLAALRAEAPPRSHIIDITTSPLDTANTAVNGCHIRKALLCKGRAGGEKINDITAGFHIIESEPDAGASFVSPDIAICPKCLAELFDPKNRRYLHPFINCTDCGPRMTVMQRLPYDRERTSMSAFSMCDECAREYHDPTSRRYDAQPVCCNDCGPTVYVLDGREREIEAISLVRRTIIEGGIAAIKGIGGFHLACDATNAAAVERLRQRKFRPSKPFAVMCRDIETVRRECVIDKRLMALLDGYQKPIVLLGKRTGGRVATNVAPFNRMLGVMLPYTPLHHLIFDLPDGHLMSDVLVMTSGNISGAPIAIDDEGARQLHSIADIILSNDRDILLRADDSVIDNDGAMLRRSRGYAPLPIHIKNTHKNNDGAVLAIGGELNNSFCLAKNGLYYLSPYVGDLTDLNTLDALKTAITRMTSLLDITPTAVACDLHPRYHSTQIAAELAERLNVPLIAVQHHHAHILSCMAENNHLDRVIGVAFDGTGFGTDGTVWGGEFLIVDVDGFERFATIDEFTQAGGDRSSVEAWRSAVSLLTAINGVDGTKKIAADLKLIDEPSIDGQLFLIRNGLNCVTSTSAGRLFDAVSATLGLCSTSTFEGEAAMKLQYIAELCDGSARSRIARAFHVGLTEFIVRTCLRARGVTGISTVALSGGVFQNSLLTSLTVDRLLSMNFRVLTHRFIPANDGGLALGQALFAMNKGG